MDPNAHPDTDPHAFRDDGPHGRPEPDANAVPAVPPLLTPEVEGLKVRVAGLEERLRMVEGHLSKLSFRVAIGP